MRIEYLTSDSESSLTRANNVFKRDKQVSPGFSTISGATKGKEYRQQVSSFPEAYWSNILNSPELGKGSKLSVLSFLWIAKDNNPEVKKWIKIQ